MITSNDLKNNYVILFQDYKEELFSLGVDIEKVSEKTLLRWFNRYMKEVEKARQPQLYLLKNRLFQITKE